ncbi:hypothetical protein [Streptomyces sp. HB132]|uniref:hypothetical protein n=1 Tax=Streptomyces sp. HB132 TaxID=767388 RepID=UPI001D6274F7|nr:hypothetical protein [Streptomyces sp. HB132]MBM7443143.1 hypothetical protein [Streptomyces sp. HB132]
MRIYGSEPGEPDVEVPGHRYAALIGGPLDGQRLDITGWSVQQLLDGSARTGRAGGPTTRDSPATRTGSTGPATPPDFRPG